MQIKMMRKGKKVVKKMEGGFTDLKIDPELIQRPKPDKVKLTRAQKREISKRRKELNKVKYPQTYPSSEPQTAK